VLLSELGVKVKLIQWFELTGNGNKVLLAAGGSQRREVEPTRNLGIYIYLTVRHEEKTSIGLQPAQAQNTTLLPGRGRIR